MLLINFIKNYMMLYKSLNCRYVSPNEIRVIYEKVQIENRRRKNLARNYDN